MSLHLKYLSGDIISIDAPINKPLATVNLKRKINVDIDPFRLRLFVPYHNIFHRRTSRRHRDLEPKRDDDGDDGDDKIVELEETDHVVINKRSDPVCGMIFVDTRPIIEIVLDSFKQNITTVPLYIKPEDTYYLAFDVDQTNYDQVKFVLTGNNNILASYGFTRVPNPEYGTAPTTIIIKLTSTQIICDQCSYVRIPYTRLWDFHYPSSNKIFISIENVKVRQCTEEERHLFDSKECTDLRSIGSEMNFLLHFE